MQKPRGEKHALSQQNSTLSVRTHWEWGWEEKGERKESSIMIGRWFRGLAYLSAPYWGMGMRMGILGGASQW